MLTFDYLVGEYITCQCYCQLRNGGAVGKPNKYQRPAEQLGITEIVKANGQFWI